MSNTLTTDKHTAIRKSHLTFLYCDINMKVRYKLKVYWMHKSSLFQLNRMTRKSKLYLLCMLFSCVVCLPCCGKRKEKATFFQTVKKKRWSSVIDQFFEHNGWGFLLDFMYCLIVSQNLADIQCVRHLIFMSDTLCSQHLLAIQVCTIECLKT